MQVAIQGSIGARPGTMRARISLARSLVPITRQDSRVSMSCATAAIAAALRIAAGVSIIAQTLVLWSAPMSISRSARFSSMTGCDTFGHQDRVGPHVMDHVDVGEPPFGVEPVDADHDLARTEARRP